MTRLLLVRHALHDWVGRGIGGRRADVLLNGEGEMQARDLAQRLAPVPLDAIYASPQPRARATAQPLAQARNMPVAIAPEFDEIDFGDWEGLTFAQLETRHGTAWQEWVHRRSRAQPPGGETIAGVRDRAMRGVMRLCIEHPHGTVVVVSHGDVIKAVVVAQLKMSLDDMETFDVACTSVTVLDAGEAGSQLKQLNGRTVP